MNKKLFFFSILVRSKIERYCSHVTKIMKFGTSHKADFLVIGVPNANIWHIYCGCSNLTILLQMSNMFIISN